MKKIKESNNIHLRKRFQLKLEEFKSMYKKSLESESKIIKDLKIIRDNKLKLQGAISAIKQILEIK